MATTFARVALGRFAASMVARALPTTATTKRAFSTKVNYTSSSSSLVDKEMMEEEEDTAAFAFPPADDSVMFRNDWTLQEVEALYQTPLLELVFQAATVHRKCHDPSQVQKCTLLSVKTGGCPEDCKYCSQSSKWSKQTGTKATPLMQVEEVLESAREAKEAGSTRFCLGAAWRGTSQVGPRQFGRVLKMIEGVNDLGMECCATLGLLSGEDALKLKQAGLTAYNHNLDTSKEHYETIISTRKYSDRLKTLQNVRDAGISVCCGGILGLGETENDRVSLLHTLATLPSHPESVPVNSLVPVEGTPLAARLKENNSKLPTTLELVRYIATARILMPHSMVRLSAGRLFMDKSDQAFCFLAGANSIFTGDRLLTTPNNDMTDDEQMFEEIGLKGRPPFTYQRNGAD
jgi:biotin synthase